MAASGHIQQGNLPIGIDADMPSEQAATTVESARMKTPLMALVWFGAAISLAEILTGTYFAPLGLTKGILAIVVGHIIGGAAFAAVAYISAKTRRSAMEAVSLSFGRFGSVTFSVMNIVQLVGWTAIMVFSGAAAAQIAMPFVGQSGWCIVIGVLIVLWVVVGMKGMTALQVVSAALLFIGSIVMSVVVFSDASAAGSAAAQATAATAATTEDAMGFGAAVELAAAMPLSWLPVVGDYTRRGVSAGRATVAAGVTYSLASTWMFIVGLGCALFAASDDVIHVLSLGGLGAVGLIIVVFSTVTTAFLDAASAGFSANTVGRRLSPRIAGAIAAVVGLIVAATLPVGQFEEFLYVIGSVFAPMAAILIADFFFARADASGMRIDAVAAVLWVAGFVLYRFSMAWDIPIGNTGAVMIIVIVATVVVRAIQRKVTGARSATGDTGERESE